jgi:hypothetical protein
LDRCALFVDAGYALGDGALAVHGTRNRDSVSWDYAGLLKLLGSLARDRTGLPLLRCYWYDVAVGSRAAEHDCVAEVPGVRLRLSKARPSRREGVEAEIRKDLTALARNRAVTDVIIVSAEEDLAPAIAEVQEFGVRTLLMQVAVDGSWAGSRALRQECDDVIDVSAGHLRPFAELIVGAEPAFGAAGYGEQLVSSGGSPLPGIDASASRLFASQLPAGYEHAPQLTAGGGQRDFAASADGISFGAARQAELGRAGSVQQGPDRQPSQLGPAALYQQAAEVTAAQHPADSAAGFGPAAVARPNATSPANGHGGSGQHDLGMSQLPGQPIAGALGMGNGVGSAGQPGPMAGGGPVNGMPGGVPGPGAEAANGTSAGALRPGPPQHSVALSNPGSGGGQFGPGPGDLGQPPSGQLAPEGMPKPQLTGQPPPSQQSLAQPRQQDIGQLPPLQQQDLGQRSLAQPPRQQDIGQLPPMLQQDLGQRSLAQPLRQQDVGQLPPLRQQDIGQLPPPQQADISQQPLGQPGQGLAVQPGGAHRMTGGPQDQNGLMPLDTQRPALAGRQLPAGNGLLYGQDQRVPYGGQPPQPHFGGPAAQPPYPPGGYGGQPAQLPALALSVGDAVQSAHAEGFGFGEAVARDAPALWLEAVLARKPRMPSDLEARLLQGSALPIDSLLHDEVRHALRRGFWDALERSRH